MAFLAISSLLGCGNKSRQDAVASTPDAVEAIEKCDSIPEAVKRLVRAVAEDDSSSFAKLVSYPLQRPYPLHDITNEEEMTAYYRQLVDDSLRNVIIKSGPEKWSEYGWRGWSLDDGSYIWVDENIYDVNYISHLEHQNLDSLNKMEIESIAPSIRKGWRPIMCLTDDEVGRVYRVDIQTEGNTSDSHHYRLAVYNPGAKLKGLPSRLLEGVMESEGSIGAISYRFHDKGSGKDYILSPESAEAMEPSLTLPDGKSVTLSRAYWHELVSKETAKGAGNSTPGNTVKSSEKSNVKSSAKSNVKSK